ncbi:unnamed protein product [Arctia plantaginis]|uniref:Nuclease HARBI1 n=1 Tax=Arctia plantaginis TaxID=874455 RepID=A0A8S1A5Y7_ARCPL|nr:unnamed protein product [Arctia plantaginis]
MIVCDSDLQIMCLLAARALHYAPNTAGQIVNACCVLHNIANRAKNPVLPLLPEEVVAENLRQYQVQEDLRAEAETVVTIGGRVNRDLLEGRAMQQALVNKLWAER